jgi:hypothetical protein
MKLMRGKENILHSLYMCNFYNSYYVACLVTWYVLELCMLIVKSNPAQFTKSERKKYVSMPVERQNRYSLHWNKIEA